MMGEPYSHLIYAMVGEVTMRKTTIAGSFSWKHGFLVIHSMYIYHKCPIPDVAKGQEKLAYPDALLPATRKTVAENVVYITATDWTALPL